ncbi:hypothetical protein Q428_03645 [Fervidicella metallireducens AeB]|uniref:DUF327 domain-containing protein n=1 Tax=Fervidicella metallireducens AeB TaxID=1403537 RepID=A0A017RXR8_9CLOT|nr:YaaR family protein [Fervidicella metallireducens]EYE89199.1 hypothetical protein Q428_03645 [Fervidicella metallireducens AeB]
MKVSGISNKNSLSKPNNTKEKSFKMESFSSSLDLAYREKTEEELQKMLQEIDRIGRRLISTRSAEDAREYKNKIKNYLSFIVKNIYILKREPGVYNYGIHTRIEIIDSKLDELTKELLNDQKESIELADRIHEIKGLLVDVYK